MNWCCIGKGVASPNTHDWFLFSTKRHSYEKRCSSNYLASLQIRWDKIYLQRGDRWKTILGLICRPPTCRKAISISISNYCMLSIRCMLRMVNSLNAPHVLSHNCNGSRWSDWHKRWGESSNVNVIKMLFTPRWSCVYGSVKNSIQAVFLCKLQYNLVP